MSAEAAPARGGDARPDRVTLLAFAAIVVLGGINAIAVKQTVSELAPFWGAGTRFVVAGLIMAGIMLVSRRRLPRGRSLVGALMYGIVGFAASFAFVYPALREAPAGTAAVFLALVPLATLGLAIAQRQERFRLRGLLGGLLAVAGVAIIFADQLSADVPLGSLALIVLGVISISEMGVIVKWIPRSDPFTTNAVAMLTAAAIMLALSLVSAERWALPAEAWTWAAVTYLMVGGSVVLFGLFVFAVTRWTASGVAYSDLLLPLVTISLAVPFTGEQASPSFLAGGVVIVAGVYIGAFWELGRRRAPPPALPECLPAEANASEAVEEKAPA